MDIIKVSDFVRKALGTEMKSVTNGSEAWVLGECNGFLNRYGYNLECDIPIDDRVQNTIYFKRMVAKGVQVDGFKPQPYNESMFCDDDVSSVEFRREVNESGNTEWVFDFGLGGNSFVLLRRAKGIYLNIFCFMVVEDWFSGERNILHYKMTEDMVSAYKCLLPLIYYGSKLAEGRLIIDARMVQPDWLAYTTVLKQRGYMVSKSSNVEKYEYFKEHFKNGDLIFLYERKKGSEQDDKVRVLIGCQIATVWGASPSGLVLKVYPQAETWLQQKIRMDDAKAHGQEVIPDEYNNFYMLRKSFDWSDMGVDFMLYDEDNFVMDLQSGDIGYATMIVPVGDEFVLQDCKLSVFEAVYAYAENRGIEYNKERFLEKYFPDSVPLYDRYRVYQPVSSDASELRKAGLSIYQSSLDEIKDYYVRHRKSE